MEGCQGDDKRAGLYITGECPTIELALKELQLHVNTYHARDLKKILKCSFPDCQYQTEFLPDESAVECLKLHVNLHHQPKEEKRVGNGQSEEGKAVFKAIKCNVLFKKNQTYESFEREVLNWKDATKGLSSHARDLLFVEAMTNAEDSDVRNFYLKNIMNNESIPKTLDDILKHLKEHLGKSSRKNWTKL